MRRSPQTCTGSEEKGEPKREIEPTSSAYQPNTLPLGQISIYVTSPPPANLNVFCGCTQFSFTRLCVVVVQQV